MDICQGIGLLAGAGPAFTEVPGMAAGGGGNQEFLIVDLDNGGVHYDGRHSGRYCVSLEHALVR